MIRLIYSYAFLPACMDYVLRLCLCYGYDYVSTLTLSLTLSLTLIMRTIFDMFMLDWQ